MRVPAGYQFRPPTPADLDPVADVLAADELDDGGPVVLDAGFLRAQWSRPGFDLASDAWVAVDGTGVIVGYGQVVLEEPGVVASWGVVRPERRGLGVGSALLDRIEQRAGGLLAGASSSRFRHAINAGDRAAESMLAARGLRPVRHFWHMQIDLAEPLDPGPPPDGIGIAEIRSPDDLPAIHAVLAEAFADHWGGYPEASETWIADETGRPTYDPTLWLRATDGGELVAALTASVLGERGWVGDLGVRARYRGRGIGAALLRRSFARFADRGVGQVILSVDAENTTGATALYERVGMRVVDRWDIWERSSDGASGRPT